MTVGDIFKDEKGHMWEAFENHAGQRRLRCLRGPRKGEEIDDPRFDVIPPSDYEIERRRAELEHGPRERDPFWAGVFAPPFWER